MIVVDIETTGVNPREHCMLSLGAVDFATGLSFYDECSIYDDTIVDCVAMDINGLDIARHKPGMMQAAHQLYWKFVMWTLTMPGDSHILAGHNVGHFDILFLEQYAKSFNTQFPFSYRTVDLHSLAYLVFGESLKHSDICNKLDLPSEPKPHNALAGAKSEAAALREIFNRFGAKTSPEDLAQTKLFP